METIDIDDFERVELRVGRVRSAEPLPNAHVPAWVLDVDFGDAIGVKRSSARITDHYAAETLVGQLVVAVVNLPPRRVGRVVSECLVTGFPDTEGAIRLCVPDGDVPLGAKLA